MHALATLGLWRFPDHQAVADIVLNRHVRKERVVLKNGVHVALVRRNPGHLFIMQGDTAGRRLFETGNHAQAGRFARTRRAEHREKLAVHNLQ